MSAFESKSKYTRQFDGDFSYGTAGFRMLAEKLGSVAYRMGLLAVLRSKFKGAVCAVMITASHNPVEDNGIKLIDPHGEMLEMAWESYATRIANSSDDVLEETYKFIADETNTDLHREGIVLVAMDTRPSGPGLITACKEGIEAAGGKACDYGLLTTPQLHYMVWAYNTPSAYECSELGYYLKLAENFGQFYQLSAAGCKPQVTIDGANGVGALKIQSLLSHISSYIDLIPVFDGTDGILNYKCGADYVKVSQQAPPSLHMVPHKHYASFDGDADRVVYYYTTDDGKFNLLDGDKIATLAASYIKELLTVSGLEGLAVGLVQTAYANGASTRYINESLNIPVSCAKTGVKYLHHEALSYDIGVYFEANGHGTVIFSKNAQDKITIACVSADSATAGGLATLKLACLMEIINQTVGDAISDLLMVEAILLDKKWSLHDWNTQYTDLPNKLMKVKISDRNVIKTTDAERRTTEPPSLQPAIDELVQKYKNGRSFVRPSGTEDVVRVYAEAESAEDVNRLAAEVANIVYDTCGGVGERPK